jgi:outer membrane protein TolC
MRQLLRKPRIRLNLNSFRSRSVGIAQSRLNAGDVTQTDTAQAEARLSRGRSDLNAAEVDLAVSEATYTQVIGNPPSQLRPAEAPRSRITTLPASHPQWNRAMEPFVVTRVVGR